MRKLIICLVVSLLPVVCVAQTAINVPSSDPVYHAIDIFASYGLIDEIVMGQRPFTRLEVARIIDNVSDNYNKDVPKFVKALLDKYLKEYDEEINLSRPNIDLRPIADATFTSIANSSKPRVIPPNNGSGGDINGLITSFDRYQNGILYNEGGYSSLHTKHTLQLSPYFALDVEPLFEFELRGGGQFDAYAHIMRLYGKAGWKNIELQVGREEMLWGQSDYGGFLSSDNARPLDMIKVANPYPWTMPWIFKYLGPTRWTFFVSNLGPENYHPYAYLYGAKFSLRPAKIFEIGLSETVIMGGEGAPGVKWWEPASELFPFHKWGGRNRYYTDISDHRFGLFDMRLTIPPLRNSVLYFESYFEDSFTRVIRLPSNFLNQTAFMVGWLMPRLSNKGDLSMRLEYVHTPPLAYHHGQWQSGYTEDQLLIGNVIGPDADGVYITFDWWPKLSLKNTIQLSYENYNSNDYWVEPDSGGGGSKILVITNKPNEQRIRMIAGARWYMKNDISIYPRVGAEYVSQDNFQIDKNALNGMVCVDISYHFDTSISK